jgi:hypothetical protein
MNDVGTLFVLYVSLIVVGVAYTAYALWSFDGSEHKEFLGVLCGASMALAGSSVFYVRKLYQACINNSYTFYDESEGGLTASGRVKRLGTFAYFLFRPLFGIAFSFVIYSLWRLSITASGASDLEPQDGFLYVTISLGFLSGFLAGRVLAMLEGYGSHKLGSILISDPP